MPEETELVDLVKSLTARVQQLEDVRELNRLRAELPRRINDGQWNRVGELFSETAHLDYQHLGQAAGRAAIQEYFASLPARIQQDKPGSRLLVKQFVHGHDVEVLGDRATGVSFFEERVVFDDESAMVAGKFTDTYVREDGRWLFSRIELSLYWVLPHPAGLVRATPSTEDRDGHPMLQKNTTKRLGYWLLHLHRLFDEATAGALAEENLNRRQWQVLHAISIGVRTVAEIDEAFAPFLAVDRESSYRPVVEEFAARGWVSVTGTDIELTASGTAAHERAEKLVNAHAARSLSGISEAEFLAANDVLARIAANIESE